MWQDDRRVWNEVYSIHSYDIDKNQKTSIQSLCRFVLDSAGNHAHALGFSVPQMFKMNLTWVLSRFFITIDSYPEWQDTITIQTWPSGLERLFAMRDFIIFDADRKVIGTAKSAWIVIDVALRKPVRPQVIFKDETNIYKEKSSDKKLLKLPGVKENTDSADSEYRRRFSVRFSDLDLNEHVTSVSYVDWLLETIPDQTRKNHTLKDIEINYISEAKYGDTVTAVSRRDTETDKRLRFNHTIRSLSELVKAETTWIRKTA